VEVYERAALLGSLHPSQYVSLANEYQHAGMPANALDAMIKSVPELEETAIRQAYADGGWKGINLHLANVLATIRPDPCFSFYLAQGGS
jgi:hypothetical protein